MAFYRKRLKKINNKWYPESITVGKPVSTDQIADRLALISTVSRADAFAVLKELAGVMADYMSNGRTVKLEGLGTFYYTANARGNGVDTEEEVNASQITSVRVRFIPEVKRNMDNRVTSRALIDKNLFWEELRDTTVQKKEGNRNNDGGEVVDPSV